MTLIEAIKSGRPFDGESPEDRGLVLWEDGPTGEAYLAKSGNFGDRRRLKVSDLYTNWEIQEPTVTITRTQFYEAFGQCFCEEPYKTTAVETTLADMLARKLGLEDK